MRQALASRAVLDHANRHGQIVTAAQARTLGANSRQISALVEHGALTRLHPGVYAVTGASRTHALAIRAAIAALRTADRGQVFVASHESAAWLEGLVQEAPSVVHVTTTTVHLRALRGVRLHRTRLALDSRPFQGILCTLPARTLVDLAATSTPRQLADAVDRALSQRIVRIRGLQLEVDKGGRRGTDQLRRCLQARGLIGAPSPSVLESRMARLITRYRLDLPEGEVITGGHGEYRIDYANPSKRLAVEVYGYAHHHTPEQMAYDHARQRQLTIGGWTVLVFTWQEVTHEPHRVARDVRRALAGRMPGTAALRTG